MEHSTSRKVKHDLNTVVVYLENALELSKQQKPDTELIQRLLAGAVEKIKASVELIET